jgi:hypothetical protein
MSVAYNFAEAPDLCNNAVFQIEIFRKTACSKCILEGGKKFGNRSVRNRGYRENVGENSNPLF